MSDPKDAAAIEAVIRDLVDRCIKAETALLIERARARYFAGSARKAVRAGTLEKAREILQQAMQEDMALVCVEIP